MLLCPLLSGTGSFSAAASEWIFLVEGSGSDWVKPKECHKVECFDISFSKALKTILEYQNKTCFSRLSTDRKFIQHGLKCSLELGTPGLEPIRSLRPG